MARFDEAAYLRLIRGQSRGLVPALARGGLGLAAGAYRLAIAARNLAYDRRWRPATQAGVPVVSVGNITLGGTGKTPMVEHVARWYRRRGIRVAILSRGYGGSEGLNDEGRVLEENLPDVPHLQDPDRVALARVATEELEAQLLILDDGFQHRRLARDLDIVLLDALDPFGQGWLFPRGLLREPIQSLRRANLVVLSRADLVTRSDRSSIRVKAERHTGKTAWVEVRHAPADLLETSGSYPLSDRLKGSRVAAFCGIGNPEGFRRTIEPLCGSVVGFRAFPDHHPYSADDVAELGHWVRGLGAEVALTTQKDYVKLRLDRLGSVPFLALRIGLEVLDGEPLFDEKLARLLPASGKDIP